jgi:hypothetical protein
VTAAAIGERVVAAERELLQRLNDKHQNKQHKI